MKTISKPGDNLGGLLKLWAVPKSVFSVSGTTVTLSDTSDVYEIYFTADSGMFKETSDSVNEGIVYNTVISVFVPGDSDDLRTALVEIEFRPYVIIFEDGNGNYKLAGSSSEPFRITAELNTGADTKDRSGIKLTCKAETSSRAVFVDNPF